MKYLFIKSLAVLLIALLLVPAALAEDITAPVEAIDEAVPETDFVELDDNAELPVEAGFVSNENYQAELSSYEADGAIPIDEAHFPDPAFRKYLAQSFIDHNQDGYLTAQERDSSSSLYLFEREIGESGATFKGLGITSLQGIEYFPNLISLQCFNNPITSLDVSMLKNLESLFCSGCSLTSLNVSGCENLGSLQCDNNQLTALDLSGCGKIWTFVCSNNQLTTLDLSAAKELAYLDCSNNALTSLDVTGHSKLGQIKCSNNQLTALDLTGCGNLNVLHIDHNPIASVDTTPCAPITKYWKKLSREVNAKEGYVRLSYYSDPRNSDSLEASIMVNASTKVMNNGKAFSDSASAAVPQLDFSGAKATKLKSSDKKIATVNSRGVVTFKKAGKVKITYSIGKKTCTVVLKVTDPTMPKSVSLSMAGSNAAKVGDKVTLTATLNEGAKSAVQWSTSDKKVATVKGGVVTFKKAGKVTITATTKRGNKKAKVKFTVSK